MRKPLAWSRKSSSASDTSPDLKSKPTRNQGPHFRQGTPFRAAHPSLSMSLKKARRPLPEMLLAVFAFFFFAFDRSATKVTILDQT
jgi:hypothetical protein